MFAGPQEVNSVALMRQRRRVEGLEGPGNGLSSYLKT